MSGIEILDAPLGGSSLTLAAVSGQLPEWYGSKLASAEAWRRAGDEVSAEFTDRDWFATLADAFDASGNAAAALDRARAGGIVVTTGQQPGLFGGPQYVLHKALAARALAQSVERATGRCTVPVFWAATDDADFAEARKVGVVLDEDRFEMLRAPEPAELGRSMSATPLGDVTQLLGELAHACGAWGDSDAMRSVMDAYGNAAQTVGGAYLALLRRLLEPLGIAVLDASHRAVRLSGDFVLRSALANAPTVSRTLAERSALIRERGFKPQVADVGALSLVLQTTSNGTRERVPLSKSVAASERAPGELLGPNVLLRPIMERAVVPTIAYVGGPGEVAYFAQVSAVADALSLPRPRVVPRWAGTVIEPRVREALNELGAQVDDLRDPHALESRLARSAIAPAVRAAVESLRASVQSAAVDLLDDESTDDQLARSVAIMRAVIEHRIRRLERRYAAKIKRAGDDASLREAAIARSHLFPGGAPAERTLSFIPLLARYGDEVVGAISAAAQRHADKLLNGG